MLLSKEMLRLWPACWLRPSELQASEASWAQLSDFQLGHGTQPQEEDALPEHLNGRLELSLPAQHEFSRTVMLSGLSMLACSWGSESVSTLKLLAEKASYIERRLDSLGASAADSLRHLTEDIWNFDPKVGSDQVLRRWIARARDEWLMRRTSAAWFYLSKAAELQLRAELIL